MLTPVVDPFDDPHDEALSTATHLARMLALTSAIHHEHARRVIVSWAEALVDALTRVLAALSVARPDRLFGKEG